MTYEGYQGSQGGPWKVASSMHSAPEQYHNLASNNTRSIHTVLEFYPSEMAIPSIEYKLYVFFYTSLVLSYVRPYHHGYLFEKRI